MPSSGVAFKSEFSNKEITKAHPIEKKIYAFNGGYAFHPGALKRDLTVLRWVFKLKTDGKEGLEHEERLKGKTEYVGGGRKEKVLEGEEEGKDRSIFLQN